MYCAECSSLGLTTVELIRRLAFVRSDNNFQGTADGGYE